MPPSLKFRNFLQEQKQPPKEFSENDVFKNFITFT